MTDSNSFQLIEHCDTDALQACIDTGYIWKHDVRKYKTYLKRASKKKSGVPVTYKKKCFNGRYYGRFWPQGKGMCCARMWSPVRSEVFSGNTLDIDMVNCVPSILSHILAENNIKSPYVHKYAENRKSFFSDVSITQEEVDAYNNRTLSACTIKDVCKQIFIAYIFGGTVDALEEEYGCEITVKGKAKKLTQEIVKSRTQLLKLPQFKQIITDIKAQHKKDKKENLIHDGTLLSHILFHLEAEYVLKAMNVFKKKRFKICSYVYDGFQVYSTDKEEVQDVLDKINSNLPATIKFIIKPFTTKCTDLTFDLVEELVVSNEMEAAQLVLDRYLNSVYVHTPTGLLVKENGVWVSGEQDKELRLLFDTPQIYKKGSNDDLVPYSYSVTHATKILKAVRALTPVNPDFIETVNQKTKYEIHFKNGFYWDVHRREFREQTFTPLARIEKDAPVHEFSKYMEHQSSTGGYHPQVQEVFDVFNAPFDGDTGHYLLTGLARAAAGCRDKVWVIMLGPRHSGKSGIQKLVREALGYQYCTTGLIPVAKRSSGDEAQNNRWILTTHQNKARINFTNELKKPDGAGKAPVLDGNSIKGIIANGGEDKVITRNHGQGEVSAVVNTMTFMSVNEIPKCEPSNALQTARLIDFSNTFTKEKMSDADKEPIDLGEWIRAKPYRSIAMLYLILDHYSDVAFQDVSIPKVCKEILNEIHEENIPDPMTKLKLSCDFGDDLNMPYDDVFKLLSNFFSKPTACTRFLKKRNLLVKRGSCGTYVGKYVKGLALKPTEEESPSECQL